MISIIRIIKEHPLLIGGFFYAIVAFLYAVFTDGVLRDDGYIFFQYAKNWSVTGYLSFNIGEESFGVTSILWTLLLIFGNYIYSEPVIVAKFYGILFGSLGAILWTKWIYNKLDKTISVFPIVLVALFPVIGAGRMVMGMEVALCCFLSGVLINILEKNDKSTGWWIGALCGLLFLARPDLFLCSIFILVFLVWKKRYMDIIKAGITGIVISAWWPILLYSKTGHFLPPTRIGKLSVFLPESLGITISQFENGSILDKFGWALYALFNFINIGFSSKLFLLLLFTAITVSLLIWFFHKKGKAKLLSIPILFILVLIFVYSYMFPLLQLRYFQFLVPALVIVVYSFVEFTFKDRRKLYVDIFILLIFIALFVPSIKRQISSTYVQQIRKDVAVQLNEITGPDDRIALEPIGEIGYYADRYIVDMGGLVNQSIQEYLIEGYTNVDLIWKCLVDNNADYLVTYDNDTFLGRLPDAYPLRFQSVAFVPEDESGKTRYQIFKILKE